MLTVLRIGPYRFYFYSHDLINEPPHVRVDRDDLSAKFWLDAIPLGVEVPNEFWITVGGLVLALAGALVANT